MQIKHVITCQSVAEIISNDLRDIVRGLRGVKCAQRGRGRVPSIGAANDYISCIRRGNWYIERGRGGALKNGQKERREQEKLSAHINVKCARG